MCSDQSLVDFEKMTRLIIVRDVGYLCSDLRIEEQATKFVLYVITHSYHCN